MSASLNHIAHLENSSPTPADIQAEEKFTKQAIIITAIAVTALLTCLIIMQWGAIAALAISVAHIIIPPLVYATGTVVTFYLNHYVWITAIGIITALAVANHFRLKKREQELLTTTKTNTQITPQQPAKQSSTSTAIALAGAHPAALPGSATAQNTLQQTQDINALALPPMPTENVLSPEEIQRLIELTMPQAPQNLPTSSVIPPAPPPPPPPKKPDSSQNKAPHPTGKAKARAPSVNPQDEINRAITQGERRLRPATERRLPPPPPNTKDPRVNLLAEIKNGTNLTPALARTLPPAPVQPETTMRDTLNRAVTARRTFVAEDALDAGSDSGDESEWE